MVGRKMEKDRNYRYTVHNNNNTGVKTKVTPMMYEVRELADCFVTYRTDSKALVFEYLPEFVCDRLIKFRQEFM